MRRVLVILISFALLGFSPVPPAHADSTVVVRTFEEDYYPGTDALEIGFGCDAVGTMGSPIRYIQGIDPAPATGLGERYWGFAPQGSQSGRFYGVGVEVDNSSSLDTFGMQVYGAAAGTGRAIIFAHPPFAVVDGYYLGVATVNGGGDAWTFVNAADLTYTWTEYEANNQPTGASGGTKTLDAFLADKGGESTNGYLAGLGFGCDGNRYFYDGFKWGPSGNVTTLDFEAFAVTLNSGASPLTITGGKKATLTGTVDPVFVGGTPVELEMRPFVSQEWSVVDEVQSNDLGVLVRKVAPLQQADYRWHFIGTVHYQDKYSVVRRVKVRTGLTAVVGDPTVQRGRKIVVNGQTTPVTPGQIVTLWRKTATGKVQLGTTIVKVDGTYKVTGNASARGTWKVFTTIPPSPGNLAGISVKRTVTIS